MNPIWILISFAMVANAWACEPPRDKYGNIKRSAYQVKKFRATHPCPSTGKTTGTCPGYVVDHVIALCNCGADKPENMQWQTKRESLVKDRYERKLCGGD